MANDSFVYEIGTEDFNKEIAENIEKRFDTSRLNIQKIITGHYQ